MKALGALLMIVGTIGAVFFFAFYDTSVLVPETGQRVNNMGLMNTRLVGVIICAALLLVGVLLVIADSLGSRSANGSADRRVSAGGFSPAVQFQGSKASMADRLEELEQRKRAAEKAGTDKTMLEQLKKNVQS